MAVTRPFFAFIKQALQRFDITDHLLLSEGFLSFMNESFEQGVIDDVGRVFYGFDFAENGGGTAIEVGGVDGFALNKDGEGLFMPSSHTLSWSYSGLGANEHRGVYVYLQEVEVTPTENRRKYDTGSNVEEDISVSVKKRKQVALYVDAADITAASMDVLTTQIVDGDGITRSLLPICILETNGASAVSDIHDVRRMFAPGGVVDSGIPDVAAEGSGGTLGEDVHAFTGVSLGMGNIRDAFKGITNRIKAITGESVWHTTPDTNLSDLSDHYTLQNGSWVESGMAVTGSTTTVTVASGVVVIDGKRWTYAGGTLTSSGANDVCEAYINAGALTVVVSSSATNGRLHLAHVDTSGTRNDLRVFAPLPRGLGGQANTDANLITVGAAATGHFATLKAAFDWITHVQKGGNITVGLVQDTPVTAPLVWPSFSGIHLTSVGRRKLLSWAFGDSTGWAITIDDGQLNTKISNIAFDSSTADSSAIKIDDNSLNNTLITDNTFDIKKEVVTIGSGVTTTLGSLEISNNRVTSCLQLLTDASAAILTTRLKIINNFVTGVTSAGVAVELTDAEGGGQIVISGNYFLGEFSRGVSITRSTLTSALLINVSDNDFYGFRFSAVKLDDNSAGSRATTSVLVSGNRCSPVTTKPTNLNHVFWCTFDGVIFRGNSVNINVIPANANMAAFGVYGNGCLVTNNSIFDGSTSGKPADCYVGILVQGTNCSITGNNVSTRSYSIASASSAVTCVVSGNILQSKEASDCIGAYTRWTISGNTIVNSGTGDGIFVSTGASYVSIAGNSIYVGTGATPIVLGNAGGTAVGAVTVVGNILSCSDGSGTLAATYFVTNPVQPGVHVACGGNVGHDATMAGDSIIDTTPSTNRSIDGTDSP